MHVRFWLWTSWINVVCVQQVLSLLRRQQDSFFRQARQGMRHGRIRLGEGANLGKLMFVLLPACDISRYVSYPAHDGFGLHSDHVPVYAWAALPREDELPLPVLPIDVKVVRKTSCWLETHTMLDLRNTHERLLSLGFHASSVAQIQQVLRDAAVLPPKE